MFTCDKCGYNTTDSSNFKRHCNRKTPCSGGKYTIIPGHNHNIGVHKHSSGVQNYNTGVQYHVTGDQNDTIDVQNNIIASKFNKLSDSRYECLKCKKVISTHLTRHLKSCKGVPSLTCKVCKKVFKHQSSHSRHQSSCKRKQELTTGTHTPESQEGQQQTVVQHITNNNTTINNNTIINNTIINIQFGKETIEELVDLINEGDERMKAIGDKLNERRNIQTTIENLIADKENYSVKKHQDLVFQEKNADDLLHVLLDLVYFNTDIPQNHTIRKINKKSDMIEIRDNDLWNPIPTNTAVHTILTPICELAQGITDDANITYPTRQYTKQDFNEILYSKTHRGYLNMERILQPYEKPQLTSEWQAFRDEVASTFIPCCGYRRSDLNKADTLQTLQEIAFRLGVLDYCPYKDGEPMFEEILQRFPE